MSSAFSRRLASDRGDTLIESLVTVVIMGVAVIAIVGGVATSIFMSTLHQQQASEQTLLRSYGDAVISSQTATWAGCSATPGQFTPASEGGSFAWTPPANYTNYHPTATAVKFWSGSQFVASPCTSGAPIQVSVQVSASRATEKMDVVVRCQGLLTPSGPCP